jgi:hypothetical protein
VIKTPTITNKHVRALKILHQIEPTDVETLWTFYLAVMMRTDRNSPVDLNEAVEIPCDLKGEDYSGNRSKKRVLVNTEFDKRTMLSEWIVTQEGMDLLNVKARYDEIMKSGKGVC